MHRHLSRALLTIAAAGALDVLLGLWFGAADHIGYWNGLYYADSTATTTGNSPYYPHGWLPYLLSTVMQWTIIPLVAATFSLMTSGLSAMQVQVSEARIKRHVEDRLRHHLGDAQ